MNPEFLIISNNNIIIYIFAIFYKDTIENKSINKIGYRVKRNNQYTLSFNAISINTTLLFKKCL